MAAPLSASRWENNIEQQLIVPSATPQAADHLSAASRAAAIWAAICRNVTVDAVAAPFVEAAPFAAGLAAGFAATGLAAGLSAGFAAAVRAAGLSAGFAVGFAVGFGFAVWFQPERDCSWFRSLECNWFRSLVSARKGMQFFILF